MVRYGVVQYVRLHCSAQLYQYAMVWYSVVQYVPVYTVPHNYTSTVWYGTVWCSTGLFTLFRAIIPVRYGTVQCGAVRACLHCSAQLYQHGMVRYSVVQYGPVYTVPRNYTSTVWYGTVWCSTGLFTLFRAIIPVRYGTVQCGAVRACLHCSAQLYQHGMVRYSVVQYGPVYTVPRNYTSTVWYGTVWCSTGLFTLFRAIMYSIK